MELEKRDKFKQKRAEQEAKTAEKDLDLTLRGMIDDVVNKFKEEDKIRALIAKDLEGKLAKSPPKKAVKKPPVDPYALQSQTLVESELQNCVNHNQTLLASKKHVEQERDELKKRELFRNLKEDAVKEPAWMREFNETMQEANLHITKLDKNNDLMNILQKQKEDKFDFGKPVDLYKTPA